MKRKIINQAGVIHVLPLLLIIAAVGIISFLLITSTAPIGGLLGSLNPKPQSHAATSGCGLTNPIFCDTFDQPMGIGDRGGDLNGLVWGTSRNSGNYNLSGAYNPWPTGMNLTGTCPSQTVDPGHDIKICNGQLNEVSNDNGTVSALTMYPKQPFDFAGRTGKVTFDVGDDTQGTHAAWPEFWITDKPVPGPFTHEATWQALPQNGFGIRFGAMCGPGQGANCAPNCSNPSSSVAAVDSAITINNFVENDTFNGGNLQLKLDDCVKQPTQVGQLNHFEIDVSQNQIDVYGTDAGTVTPLKHLATLSNVNLGFTKGLIWIEDAHYNADKFTNQRTHTFVWDNVGFDGPYTYRDLAFDANDSLTSSGGGTVNLGWLTSSSSPTTINIPNVSGMAKATGANLTFNFYAYSAPLNFTYSLNGNTTHTFNWPFKDSLSFSPRTIAIPLALSEVVSGNNTVKVWANDAMIVANFDIIMVAAGAVPCSINPSQPCNGTPIPIPTSSPTPIPTPVPTPVPTPTPTIKPSATPTSTPAPSCVKGPIGDINCDGKVDLFDYNIVLTNFNQTGTNLPGDINHDGKVDLFDYNIILTNFGK